MNILATAVTNVISKILSQKAVIQKLFLSKAKMKKILNEYNVFLSQFIDFVGILIILYFLEPKQRVSELTLANAFTSS